MNEPKHLFENERTCAECGERFWNRGPRATCCSSACYSRRWRARHSKSRSVTLAELCTEVLERRDAKSAAWSKLLPRLFRQVAVELRKLGWDPIGLLLTIPKEPATEEDVTRGGVTGRAPTRRRWIHAPERELELLTNIMERRERQGRSIVWHRKRAAKLITAIAKADL